MNLRAFLRRPRAICLLVLLVIASSASAQSPELAEKAQRGKEAMAAGKFDQAAQIYSELVKAIPGNPGLLLNLGMARHMAGHDREAIPDLEAALKIDPSIFPANLFLGASYLRLGEPAKALPPLKRAAQINAAYPDLQAMLGDALLDLGNAAEAAGYFRKLTELKPDSPAGWVGLGRSYEKLAQQAFTDLEKAAPESAYIMALVGNVRVTEQQYSSAFYLYKRALQKKPDLRGLHQALAEVYRRTEHADWAAVEEQKEKGLPPLNCVSEKLDCAWRDQRFEEVLALAKAAGPVESPYWRARAYNQLAAGSFEKLSELAPSPQLHQVIAEVHSRNGRYVEAVEQLREALKMAPDRPDLERDLVAALYGAHDYPGTAELSAKLLRAQPDDAELNWYRGDSLLFLQRVEEAIPPLKKAVELNSQLLPAHHALGRAYMQLGQDAAAIPHLKAALPLDQDGSIHYQLGQAYRTTKQLDLAKETLVKYQQMQRQAQAKQQELQQEMQITAPE